MRVRYREGAGIRDVILDFTESRFSADEMVKQVAQRLHDNQEIHTLILQNAEIYEKGMNALRHAVLGHRSLRQLSFQDLHICSYPVSTDDEYFFPLDMDATVMHLCALLQDGCLNYIELMNLEFHDRTNRHFQHFDMVEPSSMRDLLSEEKEPFYIKEIIRSLNHNPHLSGLFFSTRDTDVSHFVKEIEANIRKRRMASQMNAIFQGTHAAIDAQHIPEIIKFMAIGAWWSKVSRK
jgi:hypothetical protein